MTREKDKDSQSKPGKQVTGKALPFERPNLTKQESQIIRAAVEIEQSPFDINRDLSYWPKGIVQCALPHSNPGQVPAYTHSSGSFFLIIQPGFYQDEKTGALESLGVPYGSYPRLVCSYMARAVQRTKNRQISMGSSLSGFMHELDLVPTGGRWGTITTLKRQILALLNARIQFGYRDQARTEKGEKVEFQMGGNKIFARRYELWWVDVHSRPENLVPVHSKKRAAIDPGQTSLFENYVTLGEGLYEELLRAFPCDMRILRAIKQSSLALDLYAWATSKVFGLKRATHIPWKGMHAQFGSGYKSTDEFRRVALKHLTTIKVLYPDFKYTLERGRIVIWPSKTSVLTMPGKGR